MAEGIFDKFRRLNEEIDKKIKKNPSLFLRIKIAIDFLFERFKYDIELADYIQYGFYYRKKAGRRKFATHGELVRIIKACNDPKSRKIFDNKPEFNKHFKDFLGRSWLNAKEAGEDEIEKFLRENKKVFGKVPDGMFGRGIEIFDQTTKIDKSLVSRIKEKGLLLEENLTQLEEMRAFNESSINSCRLVTLSTLNDGIKVMAAVFRMGRKGKHADNFHHDGIASLVDVETGIVYTTGVDKDLNRYVVHPDSKVPIVGFKVPKWQEIKETVLTAAHLIPDVRYVGWDVAIKEDGRIVLIEGNPGGDFDITQVPDQVGLWPKYEKYIVELENHRREL